MRRHWLDPISRRRWQRFCRTRQALYSLWGLGLLYLLGLCANFIANDKPLLVRYEGKLYFPVLFYYPGTTFGGELSTRVDYKDLADEPRFRETEGNYMVFPPIRFGPNENIPPEAIDVGKTVQVEFQRESQVASVDLNPAGEIRRAENPAHFFGGRGFRELRGKPLAESWPTGAAFEEALKIRFANQPAPAFTTRAASADGTEVELSLPPYQPLDSAPSTLRVLLREVGVEGYQQVADFDDQGEPVNTPPELWAKLDEAAQASVRAHIVERFTRYVPDQSLTIDGSPYRVRFLREDVAYPFRPTREHPWGLDSAGRDVLVRTLYALRIALNFGFLLVIATMVVGTVLGALQGYYGGWLDLVAQRLIEIWESMPFLYVIILLGSVFGQSFGLLLFVYAIFSWIGISYYMRGEFLKLRQQPFVEAARVLGISPAKIMWRHLLPNSLVPLITFFPFSLIGAISTLNALDYLGFGLPPPTPSWGELISQAQDQTHAWWLILYPSLALFVVLLLTVFIGEGVRTAFDPRVANRIE